MKISKFSPMSIPRPQPTMTARGAFNRAVWIDGARQWKRAKLIWLSLSGSVSGFQFPSEGRLPGFVDGSQVFSRLLDERDQDQTHEVVRHASFVDNVFDLLD